MKRLQVLFLVAFSSTLLLFGCGKKEEVIAIGDNVNDKEMIEEAGLGVAMGNSTQAIKEIASIIWLLSISKGSGDF